MSEQQLPKKSSQEIAINRFGFDGYTKLNVYEECAISGFDKAYLCVVDTLAALDELKGGIDSLIYTSLIKNKIVTPAQTVLVVVINKSALFVICETFGTIVDFNPISEQSRRAYNEMIRFYSDLNIERRLSNCIIYDPRAKESTNRTKQILCSNRLYLINTIKSASTFEELEYTAVTLDYYHKCLLPNTDGKYVDNLILDIDIYQKVKQLLCYSSKIGTDKSVGMIKIHINRELDLGTMIKSAISKKMIYCKQNATREEAEALKAADLSDSKSLSQPEDITLFLIEMEIAHPDLTTPIDLCIDAYTGEITSNIRSDIVHDSAAMKYYENSADNKSDDVFKTLPRLDFNQVVYNINDDKPRLKSADDLVTALAMSPRELSAAITSHSNVFELSTIPPPTDYNLLISANVVNDEVLGEINIEYLETPRLALSQFNNAMMILPECLVFICSDSIAKLDIAVSITEDSPASREFLLDCFRRQYLLRSSYSRSVLNAVLVINIIISKTARPSTQFTLLHTTTQTDPIYFSVGYINQIVRTALHRCCATKAIYMFNNRSATHYLPKYVVSKTVELFLNRLSIISEYIRVFDKAADFYLTDMAAELRFVDLEYYIAPPNPTAPSTKSAAKYVNHILQHYELINAALNLPIDTYIVEDGSSANSITLNRVNGVIINYNLIQMYLLNKVQFVNQVATLDNTLPADTDATTMTEFIPIDKFLDTPCIKKHSEDIKLLSEVTADSDFTYIGCTTLLSVISTHYLSLKKSSPATSRSIAQVLKDIQLLDDSRELYEKLKQDLSWNDISYEQFKKAVKSTRQLDSQLKNSKKNTK